MSTGSVVVDLQALQSPDYRGRGIARYAFELAVALEQRCPELVCRYQLNPDLPPPGDLGPLLGSGKVAYGAVPGTVRLLHVLSPFELEVPIGQIWPRWAHEGGVRVCATVYDLIPLEHPHPYLDDVRQRTLYSARLEVLRGADALMTISEATSRSLTEKLGIGAGRLHMVGAGTGPRFSPAESGEQARQLAQEAVPGLEPRFVLYPAGSDGRKNVEALIVAFARLPEAVRRSRQLVVVGQLPASMENHFRYVAKREHIAGRVLCPGHVSDEAMLRLYRATGLCFPSLFEGFGLPVAEAMACGAVAIVSDVDPLRDLVGPEARFDPHSPAAIAASIERALGDEGFRTAAREHAHVGVTTWDQVAERTAAVYETLLLAPTRPGRSRRRRLAVVSPFPPLASGIAGYSFRLVEELDALGELDIDCFADGLDRAHGPARVPGGLASYDARAFLGVEAATAGYDEVVYMLGNGEFHTAALAALRKRSGIVLAHDVRLSGLYRFASDSKLAVPDGLAATIRRTYGPLLPEGLGASGQVSPLEAERYGLLMAREVIGLSRRFLVTSQAASDLARIEAGPELESRVEVVGFATEAPRADGPVVPLAPVAPGTRFMASFGIVDPMKQPHRLVHAFATLAASQPDLALAFVGPISVELAAELTGLAGALGVEGRLFVTGRVETDAYLGWLARTRLAVQLRASFSGEASAAVGDCLALGVPLLVSDLGWMGELPDDAAAKVSAYANADQLALACESLLADPGALEDLGKGARRYARAHSFAAAARALMEFIETAQAPRSAPSRRHSA